MWILINSRFLGSPMKNCFGFPAKDFDIFNLQTDQSDAVGSGEAVTKLGSSASTEFISFEKSDCLYKYKTLIQITIKISIKIKIQTRIISFEKSDC